MSEKESIDPNHLMTLGEIYRIVGISDQAIRNYEKKGILPMTVHETNGYHLYHYPDLQRAVFLRYYIKMGMSAVEASKLINNVGTDKLLQSLDYQAARTEFEIGRRRCVLEAIRSQQEWIRAIPRLLNSFFLEDSPPFYVLRCAENGIVIKNEKLKKQIQLWTDFMPAVRFGALEKMESIRRDEQPNPCFILRPEDAEFLPLQNESFVEKFPSRRCIKTVIRISSSDRDFYSVNKTLLDYMELHHYQCTGEILTYTIANKMMTEAYPDDPSDYILNWVPID